MFQFSSSCPETKDRARGSGGVVALFRPTINDRFRHLTFDGDTPMPSLLVRAPQLYLYVSFTSLLLPIMAVFTSIQLGPISRHQRSYLELQSVTLSPLLSPIVGVETRLERLLRTSLPTISYGTVQNTCVITNVKRDVLYVNGYQYTCIAAK